MFFVKVLEHSMDLHPSFFGAQASSYIIDQLYREMEGSNTGTMMIIAIINVEDVSEPKITPGTGSAKYTVSYRAIVWRPFRGEVVDGLVTSVLRHGFFVDVAGLSVFVSSGVRTS